MDAQALDVADHAPGAMDRHPRWARAAAGFLGSVCRAIEGNGVPGRECVGVGNELHEEAFRSN